MRGSGGDQAKRAANSVKEMPHRDRTLRFISGSSLILGLALILLLVFLLVPKGPALITGRRVFGESLIVSPPRPGDRHRISERQARTALDNQLFSDYLKQ